MNLRFQRCLKLARAVFLSLVVGLLVSGCSGGKREVLRVGISLDPENELLYLAQQKGFFREVGVDVRIVEFLSTSDCQRAYARGQINAMAASVVDLLYLRDRSHCSPQIVRVIDEVKESDAVLVKPGYVGQSLRNQRIGVEMGSLGVYVLVRALEKEGLSLSDVKAVSMSPNAMEDAFRNGWLDAVVTYPPFSTRLLQDNLGRSIFSANDIIGEVVGVLGVESSLVRDQKADVMKLLKGYERAVAFMR
ncbi:MAG: ABC transporter substrate-binding protein [Verrucomicrobiota bacterium]